MKNRFELLHTIIADSRSTEAEREAALKELDADNSPQGQTQDNELERYWSARESRPDRSQLSAASQAVLDDLDYFNLAIPPKPGVVERLTTLLDKTNSAVVRQRVVPVLSAIAHLIDSGRLVFNE
jgi:hypothetical protein